MQPSDTTKATLDERPLRQLNLNDPRVARWYDAVARHSDSGRCKNDASCAQCRLLEERRQTLRATPGLSLRGLRSARG